MIKSKPFYFLIDGEKYIMKRVTINDVAQHAGVSKSTVSQYLNTRYEYMSELTKNRIRDSIKELEYHPNIIARSLTQKSTMTIGVIVANVLHAFSTQVVRAIEDFCHTENFHVIICNADDNPIKEKRYIEMLRAKQVDGIVIFPTGSNSELYKKLVGAKYPVVLMDRKVPGLSADTVLLENERASELAVELFIKKGYNRIGMISPPTDKNISPRLERIKGFKEALASNNIPFNPNYLVSAETDKIKVKLQKMLELVEPPQALLASNDFVMFEILKYTKENHTKIPDELAIIGIDDVPFASFYSPEITTIAQPAFDMGKKAAELLLNRISNNSEKKTEIYRFPPRLIERSSA